MGNKQAQVAGWRWCLPALQLAADSFPYLVSDLDGVKGTRENGEVLGC